MRMMLSMLVTFIVPAMYVAFAVLPFVTSGRTAGTAMNSGDGAIHTVYAYLAAAIAANEADMNAATAILENEYANFNRPAEANGVHGVIVTNPLNPTGKVCTTDEAQVLLGFASSPGLFGVFDECHPACNINQSLDNVAWPGSLPNFTLGSDFNQSLDLAWSVAELYFAYNTNQSQENVAWPGLLQNCTFGANFNQCLDLAWFVAEPNFDYNFNQSLDIAALFGFMQNITFGSECNQRLDHA